jgi:hypothetical protein
MTAERPLRDELLRVGDYVVIERWLLDFAFSDSRLPACFFRLFLLLGRKTIGFNKSTFKTTTRELAKTLRARSDLIAKFLAAAEHVGLLSYDRSKAKGRDSKIVLYPNGIPSLKVGATFTCAVADALQAEERAVGPLYGKLIASWVATGKRGQKPKCPQWTAEEFAETVETLFRRVDEAVEKCAPSADVEVYSGNYGFSEETVQIIKRLAEKDAINERQAA